MLCWYSEDCFTQSQMNASIFNMQVLNIQVVRTTRHGMQS